MEIYNLVFGVILLLFGRRLFWLLIGIVGFLFGMEITGLYFAGQPQWLQLLIGIGIGCLGALLAVVAQRVAFTVGGFFAGVFLALKVSQTVAMPENVATLLLIFGVGVICAIVAALVMDQAITLLACLVGAGAIVVELHLGLAPSFAIFVLLTGAGFLIQEKLLPPPKENPPGS